MLAVTLPASAGETANARQVAKEARRARRSFMFFPPVRPLRGRLQRRWRGCPVAFTPGPFIGAGCPGHTPRTRDLRSMRLVTDQGPRLSAAPGETVDVMVLTSLDRSPHDSVRVLLGDQRQP